MIKKGISIFKSCDLNGIKRIDQIYLENGMEDFFYERLREKVKFVLIGCTKVLETASV